MIWLRRIRAEQTMLAIGLSLVLGGALGNVIDRVMHGYVVDFIYFHWRTLGFPGVQRRRHGDLHRRRLPAARRVSRERARQASRRRARSAAQRSRRMQILLANPRGFCAGVDRAIDIVERAIELFGAPIYVRHEVVHNRYVVDRLRSLGAVFVEELDEVPDDATVIFSAHGVSRAVQDEAQRRELKVFDATCPLVTKVHMEVARYAREGRDVILIGHEGHPEVEGTMGQFDTAFGGRILLVETPEDVEQPARSKIRRSSHS